MRILAGYALALALLAASAGLGVSMLHAATESAPAPPLRLVPGAWYTLIEDGRLSEHRLDGGAAPRVGVTGTAGSGHVVLDP